MKQVEKDIRDLLRVTRCIGDSEIMRAPSDWQLFKIVVAWMAYADRYGIRKLKITKSKRKNKA